jgi:hypothetical protein
MKKSVKLSGTAKGAIEEFVTTACKTIVYEELDVPDIHRKIVIFNEFMNKLKKKKLFNDFDVIIGKNSKTVRATVIVYPTKYIDGSDDCYSITCESEPRKTK